MKKGIYAGALFLCVVVFSSLSVAQCPPPGQPDYTIYCEDYLDLLDIDYWCCPPSYPICDYYLNTETMEYEGYCYSAGSTTSIYSPSTTTIDITTSTAPYTTTAPYVTTTVPYTTTIPGSTTSIPGVSTTTVAGTGGSGDFIVAINTNGQDAPYTQSTGILPGTNPSVPTGLLYREDGRPIPQMIDTIGPRPDVSLFKKAKRRLQELKARGVMPVQIYTVGDQKNFWVKDDRDTAWRQVAATVMRESEHSMLFVDNSLSLSQATLDSYSTEFETMYDIISENIGQFSDRDGNQKVAVFVYSMNDGGTINSFMGGYFWSKDYADDATAQSQGMRSNEMDVVYIRGNEPAGWEQVGEDFYDYNLTTLVHEFQHLVHFGVKVWQTNNMENYSDTWIDEMMAMASETMYFKHKLQETPAYTHPAMAGNGYLSGRIEYYNADPNRTIRNGHGLTYWDRRGDVLANYSLSYLFGQYLTLHSSNGQGIFKDILSYMLANGVNDYQAVAGAASQSITGISTWDDLLKSFAIANMANAASGLYGYKGQLTLTPRGPGGTNSRLHNGGCAYRVVSGAVSSPSFAGADVKFYGADGNELAGGASSGNCAASAVVDDGAEVLAALRDYRDTVMADTPAGRKLIAQYYRHSPGLIALCAEDRDLCLDVSRFVQRLLPAVKQASISDTAAFPEQLQDEAIELIETASDQSDDGLRRFLQSLKAEIASGRLPGADAKQHDDTACEQGCKKTGAGW